MVSFLQIDLQIAIIILIVLGYYFVVSSSIPQIATKPTLFNASLVLAFFVAIFLIHTGGFFAPIAYAFFLVGAMRFGSYVAAKIYSPAMDDWNKPIYFVFSICISMSLILFFMAFY